MKLNELIKSFDIFVTNEEESLLEQLGTETRPLSSFTEPVSYTHLRAHET